MAKIKIMALVLIAIACIMSMINSTCKHMNEYEAEHNCKFNGFGLCENYSDWEED